MTAEEIAEERARMMALTPAELRAEIMTNKWYAYENDLIGGWCVMPIDAPPSSGIFDVADFIDEDAAKHIAELHNYWLRSAIPGTDIRVVMPANETDPVRIQDSGLFSPEMSGGRQPEQQDIGQVFVTQQQWRRFLDLAKNGHLDLPKPT